MDAIPGEAAEQVTYTGWPAGVGASAGTTVCGEPSGASHSSGLPVVGKKFGPLLTIGNAGGAYCQPCGVTWLMT